MSGFTAIPNFTGANAGQQFRQAINAALGGSVPITPDIVGGSITNVAVSGAAPPPGDRSGLLATTSWVAANTVVTFNGRQGAVIPNSADINGALGYAAASTSATPTGFNIGGSVFGGKADGQKMIAFVSMGAGSNTLSIAALPAWHTATGYSAGTALQNFGNAYLAQQIPNWAATASYPMNFPVINGGNVYVSTMPGFSAGSGGPTGTGTGIVDNTVMWSYSGTANISAASGSGPISQRGRVLDGGVYWVALGLANATLSFSTADVGKSIAVMRQDMYGGWTPWYASQTNGLTSVAKITNFVSPTSVTLNSTATGAPTGSPNYPDQSWPYSGTVCVIMWGTDNSAAFTSALSAAWNNGVGGDVYVPGGNWCFASTIVLPSGVRLIGSGAASVLMPLGCVRNGSSANTPAIINAAGANTPLTVFSNDTVQNGVAALRDQWGDHDITIRDLQIDMSASGSAMGGFACRLYLVRNVLIQSVLCTGSPMNGYEAPNLIGCDNARIIFCQYDNATVGFNPWYGCTNILFAFNQVRVPYNGWQQVTYSTGTGGGPGRWCGVVFGVASTVNTTNQVSRNIDILYNQIFIGGTAVNDYFTAGIVIYPNGLNSAVRGARIIGNEVICSARSNLGIITFGAIESLIVSDNYLEGCDGGGIAGPGTGYYPITVISRPANSASATTIASVTPTNGSNLMVVSWPASGFTGVNLGIGYAAFYTTSSLVVGGITLNGYYAIVSVADAGHFTIMVPSNASGSTTVAWNGGVAAVLLYPQRPRISGNVLRDCMYWDALIFAQGADSHVIDNQATITQNATQNYLALVHISGPGLVPGVAVGNGGPTGLGSLGSFLGNNRIMWSPFIGTPIVVDYDAVDGKTIIASGALQGGAGLWTANGTTALSLTSVGPSGAHATVQEWFTVSDASGTVRYIPAF